MKRQTSLAMAALAVTTAAASPKTALAEADTLEVRLAELAVVAQRADSKTPVAYSVVTAADLKHANTGRDIPFLLEMTPSVVATSDAGGGIGYSSIRIRGTESSRINVTANGIPVNDAESHNVYWVNLPDMASSVRDIQIQRGVGTSVNGAGAFGASINMATDTPSPTPFATFDATYGMYNTHKETLRAGTGLLRGHWAVEARLSDIGTDGYIERASSRLLGYFAQAGWYDGPTSLRLLCFGGREKTYMAWDYASREDMEKYGRRYNPCGRYTDSDGNTAYYPDQYDNYTTTNLQLLFRHSFSRRISLDAAAHYTRGTGYYEQLKTHRSLIEYGLEPFEVVGVDADGMPTTQTVSKSDLVRLKNMANHFGGATANLRWSLGSVDLTAGAALSAYFGRHFGQVAWVRNYVGPLDPLQEYYRNNGRKIDASAYARANWDVTRRLSAYADLQWRHIRYSIRGTSDTYDYATAAPQALDIFARYDFFNPKLGLSFLPASGHRLYASWSVAHKEPVRDNFIDCDPERRPVPERLFDYEAGYSFDTRLWSLGLNLYFMDYKDQLIATGQLSDTGNAVSVNVPRSYRLGLEVQSALRPLPWLEWQFNATLSRNRIKDFIEYVYENEETNPITINHGSTPIAFSPGLILANAFNVGWRGLDASLRTRYVGRQYLSNAGEREQSLDPYCVSDLTVGWTFHNVMRLRSLRLGLAVNNIFNARYESNGYAGAGYYVDDDGAKTIYRYAGFAAQATANVAASLSIVF